MKPVGYFEQLELKRYIINIYLTKGLQALYTDKKLKTTLGDSLIDVIWQTLGLNYTVDNGELVKCDTATAIYNRYLRTSRLYEEEILYIGWTLDQMPVPALTNLNEHDLQSLRLAKDYIAMGTLGRTLEIKKVFEKWIEKQNEKTSQALYDKGVEVIKDLIAVKETENKQSPNIEYPVTFMGTAAVYADNPEVLTQALEANYFRFVYKTTEAYLTKEEYNRFYKIINEVGTYEAMFYYLLQENGDEDTKNYIIGHLLDAEDSMRFLSIPYTAIYLEGIYKFVEDFASDKRLFYKGGLNNSAYVTILDTKGNGCIYAIEQDRLGLIEEIKTKLRRTVIEDGEVVVNKKTLWRTFMSFAEPEDNNYCNLTKSNVKELR